MEDRKWKSILDSVASKTFLAILAVVGTVITIIAFIQEKKVDLRFEVIANANVLDFNADVSKLEVIYDSTNLKLTKENLRIYTIKVVNNGDKVILKEFFDENEPLGIKISSGKIIDKPEILKTSSDYLTRNLKITDYNKEGVSFTRVIIESNEYFIVKLLVLYRIDSIPQIISTGKVAGQKQIDVINTIDVRKEQTFLSKALLGSIWIQLVRLFSYFFVALLLIIIFSGIATGINTLWDNNKKKRIIEDFKKLKSYEHNKMDDAIFERYKRTGVWSFKSMQNLLEDEEYLNKKYRSIRRKLKVKEIGRHKNYEESYKLRVDEDLWTVISEMINDGLLFKENDRLVINQQMKFTLDLFMIFLIKKGELIIDEDDDDSELILQEAKFEKIEKIEKIEK